MYKIVAVFHFQSIGRWGKLKLKLAMLSRFFPKCHVQPSAAGAPSGFRGSGAIVIARGCEIKMCGMHGTLCTVPHRLGQLALPPRQPRGD